MEVFDETIQAIQWNFYQSTHFLPWY